MTQTIPDAGKLLELAAKIEAATGPDPELDAQIRCAVFAPAGSWIKQSQFNGVWCVYNGKRPSGAPRLWEPFNLSALQREGAYTASLDAAMTLVDDRAMWAHGSMEEGPFARLCWPMPNGGYVGGYFEARAATVPLALCAAALRARAASSEPAIEREGR